MHAKMKFKQMVTSDSFGKKQRKNLNRTISPKIVKDDEDKSDNSDHLNQQWEVFVKAAEDCNLNLMKPENSDSSPDKNEQK